MDRGFVGTSLDDAPTLLPGAHVVLLSRDPLASLEGRRRNLEVRDTLLVLGPDGARFAFLFRVPCSEPTVAGNVLRHGTGGLNIDGCRVRVPDSDKAAYDANMGALDRYADGRTTLGGVFDGGWRPDGSTVKNVGARWPTNLVLVHGPSCQPHAGDDGLESMAAWSCQGGCPAGALDHQSGFLAGRANKGISITGSSIWGPKTHECREIYTYGDSGGASRFFPQFAGESELIEWLGRLIGL